MYISGPGWYGKSFQASPINQAFPLFFLRICFPLLFRKDHTKYDTTVECFEVILNIRNLFFFSFLINDSKLKQQYNRSCIQFHDFWTCMENLNTIYNLSLLWELSIKFISVEWNVSGNKIGFSILDHNNVYLRTSDFLFEFIWKFNNESQLHLNSLQPRWIQLCVKKDKKKRKMINRYR